eukprot:jgi/Botrbrau1/7086/Bobra.0165s0108.1
MNFAATLEGSPKFSGRAQHPTRAMRGSLSRKTFGHMVGNEILRRHPCAQTPTRSRSGSKLHHFTQLAPPGLSSKATCWTKALPTGTADQSELVPYYSETGDNADGEDGLSFRRRRGRPKGYRLSLEARQKVSMAKLGVPRTPETRAKISQALKGVSRDSETRAKIAAAKRGVPRTPETRAKISQARKGVPRSKEAIEKQKGQKRSEETKALMSARRQGYKHSEEAKEKMRQAALARYREQGDAKSEGGGRMPQRKGHRGHNGGRKDDASSNLKGHALIAALKEFKSLRDQFGDIFDRMDKLLADEPALAQSLEAQDPARYASFQRYRELRTWIRRS